MQQTNRRFVNDGGRIPCRAWVAETANTKRPIPKTWKLHLLFQWEFLGISAFQTTAGNTRRPITKGGARETQRVLQCDQWLHKMCADNTARIPATCTSTL